MNLDKAIELLDLITKYSSICQSADAIAAIKLGIEALKDKLEARRHGHAYSQKLLPGETPEGESP